MSFDVAGLLESPLVQEQQVCRSLNLLPVPDLESLPEYLANVLGFSVPRTMKLNSGRRVGKHALTMPIFSSTTDQSTPSTLDHERSKTVISRTCRARIMLTMQTLEYKMLSNY